MARPRWLPLPLDARGAASPGRLRSTGFAPGLLLPSLLLAPAALHAAGYAMPDEVARRAFPTATAFREQLIAPSADDAAALAAPGEAPRTAPLRAIEARQGDAVLGHVVVDAVRGKFEPIDYAVAIGRDHRILAVEVLAYRESHGGEVRLPAWRAQFAGKGPADALRVGSDIANISGATLSCSHLTDGVRRIVAWVARATQAGRL